MSEGDLAVILCAIAGVMRILRYFVADVLADLNEIVLHVRECWRIWFPAKKENRANTSFRTHEGHNVAAFESEESGMSSDHRECILIADSDPQVRRLFTIVGKRRGYEVHEADRPSTIVSLVESIKFDRVVMDIPTLGDDAHDLVRRIGKERTILTSAGNDATAGAVFGCRYVQKPFSLRIIFAPHQTKAA